MHGFRYKGFGADLALEMCFEAISGGSRDEYRTQPAMLGSSATAQAKIARDIEMYKIL